MGRGEDRRVSHLSRHPVVVSQFGTSRQPAAWRAVPGICALAGRRESVPGDPAGTGGAVPQTAPMTPWMPVSSKCWCDPSVRMTKSSSQHRSGCRRSLENAIWLPSGEYAGPKLLVGHGVVASLVAAVPLDLMTQMRD